ncbi:TetR/AcrR family transcriptional regulator [Allokutzneria sp. A3M-2-11 16]|uniref:TetR/AcrR family transcriptional regulator n=1 Tax=Allokutzneria sp. A3M-2-11 16 TaxID=2962043 RepID=UPI0020B7C86B|nr:TetR/AcrR family transcriptional regulator [Allokutzneria sp. A3M-2-11 16]MCP3804176.1 TetR/AcrR family transcriptional regulator [Allokutzneria sp. A3M-2-11 16]
MTAARTGPGRPREFDEDAVLDAAGEAFLRRGYHATSLTDLTTATGLHRGSLYGAFGDKHRLFLAALRRHARLAAAAVEDDLANAATPLEGIRALLLRQARKAMQHMDECRGCLLANSTLEMLPGDEQVAGIIAGHYRWREDRLTETLELARAQGQSTAAPPRAFARYVGTVIEGLWQLGRTASDPRQLTEVAEAAMRALR